MAAYLQTSGCSSETPAPLGSSQLSQNLQAEDGVAQPAKPEVDSKTAEDKNSPVDNSASQIDIEESIAQSSSPISGQWLVCKSAEGLVAGKLKLSCLIFESNKLDGLIINSWFLTVQPRDKPQIEPVLTEGVDTFGNHKVDFEIEIADLGENDDKIVIAATINFTHDENQFAETTTKALSLGVFLGDIGINVENALISMTLNPVGADPSIDFKVVDAAKAALEFSKIEIRRNFSATAPADCKSGDLAGSFLPPESELSANDAYWDGLIKEGAFKIFTEIQIRGAEQILSYRLCYFDLDGQVAKFELPKTIQPDSLTKTKL